MEGSEIWAVDTENDLFSFQHSAHTQRFPCWHVRQQLLLLSALLPPLSTFCNKPCASSSPGRLWHAISRLYCWLALSLLSPEFPEHLVLFLFPTAPITFCTVKTNFMEYLLQPSAVLGARNTGIIRQVPSLQWVIVSWRVGGVHSYRTFPSL